MRGPGVGGVACESPRRDLPRSLGADSGSFLLCYCCGLPREWGNPRGSGRGKAQEGEGSLQCLGGLFRSRATPHSPVTGFVTSQQLQREGLAPRGSLPAPNSWMSQDESVRAESAH